MIKSELAEGASKGNGVFDAGAGAGIIIAVTYVFVTIYTAKNSDLRRGS